MLGWLADVLSPPRCAACSLLLSRRGHVFCGGCAGGGEHRASSCAGGGVGMYGGALGDAIRRFKYEDAPYLSRPLGALLRRACRAAGLSVDLVVPVPLHSRRLMARGYNQSALLGAEAAAELGSRLSARALV